MRKVLVLLAAVLALLTLTGAPARADYGTVTTVVLAADTSFYPTNQTAIVLRMVTLAAGEYRHVKTRLEATSSTTDTVAMDNIIQCTMVDGTIVGVTSASSRNHEGYDTTSYALDGHLPIYADLLFRAPSAGTYTCKLVGWTDSSHGTGYHLTAVAGSTWLQISDVNEVGANWWQNPACDSQGTLPRAPTSVRARTRRMSSTTTGPEPTSGT